MNNEIYLRVEKLVRSLSPATKTVLFNYLHSNLLPWQQENKTAKLLRCLDREERGSEKEFTRKNYEILEARIFDSIFLDINIRRKGKGWEGIYLRKEILKVHLFSFYKIHNSVHRQAERCKKLALQDQDYDKILEALYAKLPFISFHRNISLFKKVRDEIDHYENLRSIQWAGLRLFCELKIKRHLDMRESFRKFVDAGLKVLEESSKESSSSVLSFIYEYFRKEKLEIEGEYLKAQSQVMKLYSLANSLSPGFKPYFSIWELVLDQARICYKTSYIGDARNFAERCLANTEEHEEVNYYALKLVFYIRFLEQEYDEAAELVENYMKTVFYQHDLSGHLRATWEYLLACVYFRAGDFARCQHLLNQKSMLENENWEDSVRIRFLRIMTAIELKEYDKSDKYLHSLRRYISRKKLSRLMEKEGLAHFYKGLSKLRTAGYSFDKYSKVHTGPQDLLQPGPYDFTHSFYRRALSCSGWINSKLNKPVRKNPKYTGTSSRIFDRYKSGKMQIP